MSSASDVNEQQLAAATAKGDRNAMQSLYRCYVRYLTAVCSRYVTDDDDVKDIMQDVFIKVFDSIASFSYRGPGSLKAWLTRVTLNEALGFIRRRGRLSSVELGDNTSDIPDDPPDTDNIPSDVIFSMIRNLPDGYRTVFNLYVIEEKSHREIAEMLGIKESSSASQLHRAKAMLADMIKRYRTINSL